MGVAGVGTPGPLNFIIPCVWTRTEPLAAEAFSQTPFIKWMRVSMARWLL